MTAEDLPVAALEVAALMAARLAGCSCDPEFRFERDETHPQAVHCHIAHDSTCTLLLRQEAANN